MVDGKGIVRIDYLRCPREQLGNHTYTVRAVSRRKGLAASMRGWGNVQLQLRLSVGTRSSPLALTDAPERHRPGPTARFADGLTATSRFSWSNRQLQILLPCAKG